MAGQSAIDPISGVDFKLMARLSKVEQAAANQVQAQERHCF